MKAKASTIDGLLREARLTLPLREARLLLGHLLGRDTGWLEAHRETELPPDIVEKFSVLAKRRAFGEPIAYLLGVREFYGRDFIVTPDVLIPRPETELLIDIVKEKYFAADDVRLLELGTGSGCLAITLAIELPWASVTAVDISPAALAVAKRNAARQAASLTFIESDWFAALPPERFDLIVANPPYVAAGDPHLATGDLRFEPQIALTDHADGCSALRHIIHAAPDWLIPGGWLLCEHGYDQAEIMSGLLARAGFEPTEHHRDLAGIVRVSGGKIPD